jgi:hypothetical protein
LDEMRPQSCGRDGSTASLSRVAGILVLTGDAQALLSCFGRTAKTPFLPATFFFVREGVRSRIMKKSVRTKCHKSDAGADIIIISGPSVNRHEVPERRTAGAGRSGSPHGAPGRGLRAARAEPVSLAHIIGRRRCRWLTRSAQCSHGMGLKPFAAGLRPSASQPTTPAAMFLDVKEAERGRSSCRGPFGLRWRSPKRPLVGCKLRVLRNSAPLRSR